MVHIGFSVLKAANKAKDSKVDPPETVTPPLTPADSHSSPPNQVTIRKRLGSDGDEQVIYNTDSSISELTYHQTPGYVHEIQPQHLRDPPGRQHGWYSTDVALRTFNDGNGPESGKAFDPPAVDQSKSSMGESLVTRVLGIVDIGCVSPFAESTQLRPPSITSEHVEWGVAPTATLYDDETIPYTEVNASGHINSDTKDTSNLTDSTAVVCVSQDDNQHEHLQLILPPSSPVSSPGVESWNGKERKASWVKSKLASKRSKKEEARPHQKVEAVLGIMPPDKNSSFMASPTIGKSIDFQKWEGGIYEEKKDDEERLVSIVDKDVKVEEVQNRKTSSNNRAKTPTRPRNKSDHNRISAINESSDHRRQNHQKESARQAGSGAANILLKALTSNLKNSSADDPNVMQKLKDGVRSAFQAKRKKDSDRRQTERDVPESSNEKKRNKVQVKETNIEKVVYKNEEQAEEITETTVVTTNVENGSELRLRKVLKSIKGTSSGQLETVEEIAEDDASCSSTATAELRVRIPGVHDGAPDAYISDKDLIGDEFVEEEPVSAQSYSSKEFIASNKLPNQQKDQKDSMVMSHNMSTAVDELIGFVHEERTNGINGFNLSNPFASGSEKKVSIVENKTPVVEKRDRLAPVVRTRSISPTPVKNKSWKDYLGISLPEIQATILDSQNYQNRKLLTSNDVNNISNEVNVPSQQSETSLRDNLPAQSADKNAESTTEPTSVHKPMWKAVIDPNSGRTYYYHRQTRETTWAKPPDKDLVPMKPKTVSKIVTTPTSSTLNQTTVTKLDPFSSKKCPPECDPLVWKKKQDIARLLTEIVEPPTPECVEQLLRQYAGREDELKAQLVDLSGSKPFDEPITPDDEKYADERKMLAAFPSSNASVALSSVALSRAVASVQSGFSGNMSSSTRISEKTQQIRNTTSGNPKFANLEKGLLRTSSDISTKVDIPSPKRVYPVQPSAPIPKNIPVPRTRELKVEEFTTRDPLFGVKESDMHERKARVFSRIQRLQSKAEPKPVQHATSYFHNNVAPYLGDIEDPETDRDNGSYGPADSVSALSEADFSFVTRQESLEMTRRRALHEALANKDWDRAADISETMRMERRIHGPNVSRVADWSKDPLDQFISRNDWDAVATHIAQRKASDKKVQCHPKTAGITRHGAKQKYAEAALRASTKTSNSNTSDRFCRLKDETKSYQRAKIRIGANSRVQHSADEGRSYSSYSTYSHSSYTSEYTSGSYFSTEEEPSLVAIAQRKTAKEKFRC